MSKELLQIGVVPDGATTGEDNFKAYRNSLIAISGSIVLLVDSGYAIVTVGFKRRVLQRGMMAVLFYDDTFWVERCSGNFRCRYVALSYDNTQEAIYKLTSPHFWDSLSENPLFLLSEEQQQHIERWYAEMEWICKDLAREYIDTMLRNNLHNLFMAMDSEMIRGGIVEKKGISRNRVLIINFLKLLSQHCHHTREVSFYASQLCITTTYLYKLTSKRWKLSPKEIIDQQTICELKTLLTNTEMSVKEIADKFHFEDTPYMCRYFRRHTGVTPTEYRNFH